MALEQLRSHVRTGFELLPDSIVFTPSALLQADTESIRFEMIAKGRAAAAIDRVTIVNTVRGTKVKDAADWLSRNLSLTRDPQIDLRSDTFNMERIPLFTFRIQVRCSTVSECPNHYELWLWTWASAERRRPQRRDPTLATPYAGCSGGRLMVCCKTSTKSYRRKPWPRWR